MADAPLPGQTYACFVRSPHACADVKSIDTKAALAIKGVIAVITAADIKAAECEATCRSIRRLRAAAAAS